MRLKNMYWRLIGAISFLFLLLNTPSRAIDIGSDSDTDFFTTQQTLNDGDRIAFGAILKAGFKLNNSSVTGTFSSCFPVISGKDIGRI